MRLQKFTITAALAFAALLTSVNAPQTHAAAFYPGTVIKVSKFDVLNIRKWPSHQSRIVIGEPNGARLSMTGRCKNIKTNISFRIDGRQSPRWKYKRMRRANVWCQIMSRNNHLSWARGKFVWPQ